MGMNDIQTVALIGGGHAFGKCHGACSTGPGPNPSENPLNPWPGTCNNDPNHPIGRGTNTFTSGIEGQWTTYPFMWDNEFFTQLRDHKFNLTMSPNNAYQWINLENGNLMLTTDLALVNDETYKRIVYNFADDIDQLNDAFGSAWEVLTTNGGRWAENKHCVNAMDVIIDSDTMPSGNGPLITNKFGIDFLYAIYISNIPSYITITSVKIKHNGRNCNTDDNNDGWCEEAYYYPGSKYYKFYKTAPFVGPFSFSITASNGQTIKSYDIIQTFKMGESGRMDQSFSGY